MHKFLYIAAGLLISLESYAIDCMHVDPKDRAAKHDHIFVAFVTSAYYEETPAFPDGRVIGLLQPTETLKGNPNLVPGIYKPAPRRDGMTIGGVPRDFPVGSYVLVFSNGDLAPIDGCNPSTRIHYIPNETCSVDQYRRALDIDHPDSPFCRDREAASRTWALERSKKQSQPVPDD